MKFLLFNEVNTFDYEQLTCAPKNYQIILIMFPN